MKSTTNTTKTTATVEIDNRSWAFTQDSVGVLGHTFPASYSLAKTGDVYAITAIEGVGVRLHIGTSSPAYHAAFDAAMAAKAPAKQEKPAAKAAKAPAKQEKPAAKAAKAPAKQEKPVVNSDTISGADWAIKFDEQLQRTRVILADNVRENVKATVIAAGFYWSRQMGSYNKHLTARAKKAAIALAEQLQALN